MTGLIVPIRIGRFGCGSCSHQSQIADPVSESAPHSRRRPASRHNVPAPLPPPHRRGACRRRHLGGIRRAGRVRGMVTAHAQAVGGVDDAGAGRATMISVSRFLGARSCSSSSGRSSAHGPAACRSPWYLSAPLDNIGAARLQSTTFTHAPAHPELDRNAFLPRCAAAAASWAWAEACARAGVQVQARG